MFPFIPASIHIMMSVVFFVLFSIFRVRNHHHQGRCCRTGSDSTGLSPRGACSNKRLCPDSHGSSTDGMSQQAAVQRYTWGRRWVAGSLQCTQQIPSWSSYPLRWQTIYLSFMHVNSHILLLASPTTLRRDFPQQKKLQAACDVAATLQSEQAACDK